MERPPINLTRRVLIAVTLLLMLFAIAAFVGRFYEQGRTRDKLDAILAKLNADEPGWRLEDLINNRPEPPVGKNSAAVIAALVKLIPSNWPTWNPDQSEYFETLAPNEVPADPIRKEFLDEMKKFALVAEQARELADMPLGKHPLVLRDSPYDIILNYQQDSRRVVTLLMYDAWARSLEGEISTALLDSRACINAGRSLNDEPFGISQMIRHAAVAVACKSIEKSLALGEARDNELHVVQQTIRLEEAHPTRLIVLRGERASAVAMIEGVAQGKIDRSYIFAMARANKPMDLLDRVLSRGAMNLPLQQLTTLENLNELIEIARLPSHEQISHENALQTKVNSLPASHALVREIIPSLLKMSDGWRRKAAQLRTMDALLAVERYRLKHGQWPDKLEDIPKEWLPAIPLDPYDGKPLRYGRTAEGVVVYTVGPNLRDDGGQVVRNPMSEILNDIGYRLWDVAKRRQPAPPPARPELHEDGMGGPGEPPPPGK